MNGSLANKTALLNDTVSFECRTVSDLEPYIQWFRTNTSANGKNENNANMTDMTTDRLLQVKGLGEMVMVLGVMVQSTIENHWFRIF